MAREVKAGDRIVVTTYVCDVTRFDNGDIEHTCIFNPGDGATVLAVLDDKGTVQVKGDYVQQWDLESWTYKLELPL